MRQLGTVFLSGLLIFFVAACDDAKKNGSSGRTTHPIKSFLQQNISAGYFHTCSLKSDGGVWCWGTGNNGRLGNDDDSDKDHPVQVVNGNGSTTFLDDAIAIIAGDSHTCALKQDGTIWCWGYGGNGRLGNDDDSNKDHPVQVVDGDGSTTFLRDVIAISTSNDHTCALKSDGTVWCWGDGGPRSLG